MEADWSAEIGSDLPRIDVPWEGWIDLRASAGLASGGHEAAGQALAIQEAAGRALAIQAITEAAEHPALRSALVRLNEDGSQTRTSKCDLWTLGEEDIEADEFDADEADARAGFACYIDVVSVNPRMFVSFAAHEQWARAITEELRSSGTKNGRVECVLRAATLEGQEGFGLTVYAAGCGSAAPAAYATWEAVLAAAVAAVSSTQPAEASAG